MPLICIIPLDISLKDKSFKRVLQYDSSYKRKYSIDIMRIVNDYYEEFSVVDSNEKRAFAELLCSLLTRVLRFWLEKIFKPLSHELDLPEQAVCRCCKRIQTIRKCDHDLLISSHYDDKSTSKVKVDLFSGPPSISINTAAQEDSDIDRFKRYYTILVERYHELPCCRCCPISTDLIHDIEDQIDESENIISTLVFCMERRAKSNDYEITDEQETTV